MLKLSTNTVILLVFLFTGLFWQCQDIPPVASPLAYVSADQNETARRPSTGCAFRYNIVNTFKRIDNQSQYDAIRAGFALWQKVNPNVGFLELPDKPTLLIKFVETTEIPNPTTTSTVGLGRGSNMVGGGLRKESNGTYTILLSNSFDWNAASLTKAIAYHAGLFLGLATTTESSSLMSTLFVGQTLKASKTDSVAINKLYATTCKDIAVSYLPLSLTVGGPVTKTIKFDKQGTISIKASGQMIVGEWVGNSGPEGRLTGGLFNASLEEYNIVKTMYHAALMYKLKEEANWTYCGPGCNFSTAGLQYVDLIFNINDNDLTDDKGGYDVVVSYK